ncbi:unnamed protein product, partial [Didymodactylos carnosus]
MNNDDRSTGVKIEQDLSDRKLIRILYVPPYYECHVDLAINRLVLSNSSIEYRIFTIDEKYLIYDEYGLLNLNQILIMCRELINEHKIQCVLCDKQLGQLIVSKLINEYPQLIGMSFQLTLKCLNKYLMINLIENIDECVPTLFVDSTIDRSINFCTIKNFLIIKNVGFVKPLFSLDKLSSFKFHSWETYENMINKYELFYQRHYQRDTLSLFRTYISPKQYPHLFKPGYIIQPYYDLLTYPYWRHIIASACVFDNDVIMWPLTDGSCGWPFLAEKPLGILSILVCPSQQISLKQQELIYVKFRQHIQKLHQFHYGWIQAEYFISCDDTIHLISIQPNYSVYLCQAYNYVCQFGDPITCIVNLSLKKRPKLPILNGKIVYINRLWTNACGQYTKDLINFHEYKRLKRLGLQESKYILLRLKENDQISNESDEMNDSDGMMELGLIQ